MSDSARSGWKDRLLTAYPALRRFAAVVGSNDMSPDDLVHDSIVAAMSGDRLDDVDDVDDVEAYLCRAIVNVAANERRRLGRRRNAWERVRAETGRQRARDAYPSDLAHLVQLDPQSRAVLFLHYVEGRTFEQVAELLDLRPPAVRQIAARARRKLRLQEGVTQ